MQVFKKDSRGNVRVWEAHTLDWGRFEVNHGMLNGKMQSEVTQCYPKNVGRANATTEGQQAELEVAALYEKKVSRDGYKYNLDDEDALIAPMLALDYSKVPHRVPDDQDLYLSRKLDGLRCIWIQGKGLQSRKGKFYDIPHIAEALKDVSEKLDGEIYLHGYPLNQIVSAAKKTNALTPLLEFHVFDVIRPQYFSVRSQAYADVVTQVGNPCIKYVAQFIRRKSEINDSHDLFIREGFEGAMIRLNDFAYEHSRSASLFKYKEFEESEYVVLGVREDKEGGAVMQCDGFSVRCRGTDAERRYQALNPDKFIGKLLTVRYKVLSEFGKPIPPVGICFRDYE